MLEIEVEGQPKKVKWYKNGDELKDAKAEDLGDGKFRLTVPGVSKLLIFSVLLGVKAERIFQFKDSDVGEYSVTAENEVGEIESKAKVRLFISVLL